MSTDTTDPTEHTTTDKNILVRRHVERLDAAQRDLESTGALIEREEAELAGLVAARGEAPRLPLPEVTPRHRRGLIAAHVVAASVTAAIAAGLVLHRAGGVLAALIGGAISGGFAGVVALATGCLLVVALPATSQREAGRHEPWSRVARIGVVALVVLAGVQVLVTARHWAIAIVTTTWVAMAGVLWAARLHGGHQLRLRLDEEVAAAEQRVRELRVQRIDREREVESASIALRRRECELSHHALG